MDITVSGSGTRSLAPERARLHLELGFDTEDRAESLTRATALVSRVSDALRATQAQEGSPVVSSTVQPVLVHPYRPTSDTGEPLPWRFRAGSHVEVRFAAVDALAGFMEDWGRADGVTLGAVDWTLTERSRVLLEDEALGAAVADAQRRATVIARSAGAVAAHLIEVTETGPGDHPPSPLARMAVFGSPGMDGPRTVLELRPADVEVTANVRARFSTVAPDEDA